MIDMLKMIDLIAFHLVQHVLRDRASAKVSFFSPLAHKSTALGRRRHTHTANIGLFARQYAIVMVLIFKIAKYLFTECYYSSFVELHATTWKSSNDARGRAAQSINHSATATSSQCSD